VADSLTENPPALSAVNVQLNNVSATRKSIVVTLDSNEVDAEHQAVVGEISKLARIPGFRPGKAPAAMVARRFSKEIGEDFKQKVIAKAYRSALDQEKLDVLNVVKVEEGKIATGSPANVTITLDVRPDFALPDYTNLHTEIAPSDPTDAEVDSVIQGLRSERADFKPADRPSQKSDYVKLGYEGRVDGNAITDLAPDKQLYGKVPQTWEEVEGTNEGVIPGLGNQLAGLKAGDKKDVTITFPADFAPVPALAGKTAIYSVEIQEIRERVLPELNEEFFKSQRGDNLAGFQAQVRNNLKMPIAGLSQGCDQIAVRGDRDGGRSFVVFYFKAGTLIAADCVNRPQEFMAARRIIAEGRAVSAEILVNEAITPQSWLGH
jgi:trigger factor